MQVHMLAGADPNTHPLLREEATDKKEEGGRGGEVERGREGDRETEIAVEVRLHNHALQGLFSTLETFSDWKHWFCFQTDTQTYTQTYTHTDFEIIFFSVCVSSFDPVAQGSVS